MSVRTRRACPPALRNAALVLLVLVVTGCGFRLRGAVELPPVMATTWVDARGVSGELRDQTRRVLQSAGTRLAAGAGEASARLRLMEERSDRRVLSVDAGGQVREYELFYGVRFELRDRAGEVVVPEQVVELVRAVTFDPGEAALGRMTEQEVVRREMVQVAVNQMMQRIVATARSAPPAAAPADPVPTAPDTEPAAPAPAAPAPHAPAP